jgi:hypothetical protein
MMLPATMPADFGFVLLAAGLGHWEAVGCGEEVADLRLKVLVVPGAVVGIVIMVLVNADSEA